MCDQFDRATLRALAVCLCVATLMAQPTLADGPLADDQGERTLLRQLHARSDAEGRLETIDRIVARGLTSLDVRSALRQVSLNDVDAQVRGSARFALIKLQAMAPPTAGNKVNRQMVERLDQIASTETVEEFDPHSIAASGSTTVGQVESVAAWTEDGNDSGEKVTTAAATETAPAAKIEAVTAKRPANTQGSAPLKIQKKDQQQAEVVLVPRAHPVIKETEEPTPTTEQPEPQAGVLEALERAWVAQRDAASPAGEPQLMLVPGSVPVPNIDGFQVDAPPETAPIPAVPETPVDVVPPNVEPRQPAVVVARKVSPPAEPTAFPASAFPPVPTETEEPAPLPIPKVSMASVTSAPPAPIARPTMGTPSPMPEETNEIESIPAVKPVAELADGAPLEISRVRPIPEADFEESSIAESEDALPAVNRPMVPLATIPRDVASRKNMAKEMLDQARQRLKEGDISGAETLLFQVRELAVEYGVFQYSPDTLARDINRARRNSRINENL